jgi:hypothetical protein
MHRFWLSQTSTNSTAMTRRCSPCGRSSCSRFLGPPGGSRPRELVTLDCLFSFRSETIGSELRSKC